MKGSWRTPLVFLVLLGSAHLGCHHGFQKTASISVLISQADDGPTVPCTIELAPLKPSTTWRMSPPPQLRSRGRALWFPEMGYFESWPTEFIATLTCEGYLPWRARVESGSAFRPAISVEAIVRKGARS